MNFHEAREIQPTPSHTEQRRITEYRPGSLVHVLPKGSDSLPFGAMILSIRPTKQVRNPQVMVLVQDSFQTYIRDYIGNRRILKMAKTGERLSLGGGTLAVPYNVFW